MVKLYDELPDGIIITLPVRFFTEQSPRKYLEELQRMNDDPVCTWIRICKNLPKLDVLYVYVIINGRIHHRVNFAGVERNRDYVFSRNDDDQKVYRQANAIIMCGPVVRPPYKIKMRGFQGFRYTNKIF